LIYNFQQGGLIKKIKRRLRNQAPFFIVGYASSVPMQLIILLCNSYILNSNIIGSHEAFLAIFQKPLNY